MFIQWYCTYEACTEKLLNKLRNKAMNNKTSTKLKKNNKINSPTSPSHAFFFCWCFNFYCYCFISSTTKRVLNTSLVKQQTEAKDPSGKNEETMLNKTIMFSCHYLIIHCRDLQKNKLLRGGVLTLQKIIRKKLIASL